MFWEILRTFLAAKASPSERKWLCFVQDSADAQPMQDLIPYFWNTGAAADGLHNRLSGVFWWAWNSNAGTDPSL